MTISTAEQFFAVLDKSNLLTAEQLADARAAGRQSDDPTAIARILVQEELLTRWQAGQLLAGRSSFFLGKYKLIELLGRGGMGSVFLARHTTMDRRVALKIVSKQAGRDPASLERFFSEARAVAALDHPNIVHAYSFDNEGDRYYMVMEYVDGRDLQQLVEAEGPLDYERAADYIRQAADGLAHGHQREMIHCDVKPSNLLVNDQGMVKIVDMGLARLTGPGGENTNGQNEQDEEVRRPDDEELLGSVDYLSPEQALKSPDLDHRADIYSLGCTFYFLLTGHPPFPEGSLHERLMKHQTQQPQSILQQRPRAPKDLVDLCQTMMAKRPEDRPQSAEEVSRILAAWHPSEPKPRQAVPLRRAEALADPAEGALPSIDLGTARKPTADNAAKKKDSLAAVGFLSTPRRKIVATVVAVLVAAALLVAVAVLAATFPLLMGRASDSGEKQRPPTKSSRLTAGKDLPNGRHRKPSDRPRKAKNRPPSLNPPTKEPGADPTPPQESPPDRPPDNPAEQEPDSASKPDAREPVTPEPDKPESDKPEPDEPKPDEPKPDQPKKPEEKDPFRELAGAVRLPELDAKTPADGQPSEPVSLGTLHLEPGASWNIELKGGKDAGKRGRKFSLGRGKEGTDWLAYLERQADTSGESERTEVARIWLEDQALKFQWLHDALSARGNYLRNYGLSIRVDGKSHWLALATPREVKPLVLDLERGGATAPLPTDDWIARTRTLRIEVTGLEGPLAKPEYVPAGRVSEEGKFVDVVFREEELPPVRLRVGFVAKRGRSEVEAVAAYQLADQQWYPMKRMEAERQMLFMSRKYAELKSLTDRMDRNHPARDALKQQREAFKKAAEQIEALGERYREIHNTGTVHFRVLSTIDDHQVVLFTTKPARPENPK